jgi:hypothetical protein
MASSLISTLTVTTPVTGTSLAPVTDREHCDLLHVLSTVPDPRDPRGIRYPMSALLVVAVCAVLAGASSFAAIVDWLYDLDEQARTRLGFAGGVPAGTTVWRLLTRLDDTLLATVLAGWLNARTRQPDTARPGRYRKVIAVDGKPCAVPAATTAATSTCCPRWTPAPASFRPRSLSTRSPTRSPPSRLCSTPSTPC